MLLLLPLLSLTLWLVLGATSEAFTSTSRGPGLVGLWENENCERRSSGLLTGTVSPVPPNSCEGRSPVPMRSTASLAAATMGPTTTTTTTPTTTTTTTLPESSGSTDEARAVASAWEAIVTTFGLGLIAGLLVVR